MPFGSRPRCARAHTTLVLARTARQQHWLEFIARLFECQVPFLSEFAQGLHGVLGQVVRLSFEVVRRRATTTLLNGGGVG